MCISTMQARTKHLSILRVSEGIALLAASANSSSSSSSSSGTSLQVQDIGNFDIACATLSALCGSDRSRCGTVLMILADSLRSWVLAKRFFEFSGNSFFDDLARVHGAVLEVDDMQILTEVL